MTMTTLAAALGDPEPVDLTPTTPVLDRHLSDDELASVIAQVLATDHEHGIVAALAVFEAAATERHPADHNHAFGEAAIPAVPAIPIHQWRAIQAVIDSEARRHAPGSESEVLADWVDFGPRISAG